jgi:hypothetical protein
MAPVARLGSISGTITAQAGVEIALKSKPNPIPRVKNDIHRRGLNFIVETSWSQNFAAKTRQERKNQRYKL